MTTWTVVLLSMILVPGAVMAALWLIEIYTDPESEFGGHRGTAKSS